MQLPLERGPISRHVIETLAGADDGATHRDRARPGMLADADVQLALWILYELHYRGFDGRARRPRVGPRACSACGARSSVRFEHELRGAARRPLIGCPARATSADQLVALVDADDGPSLGDLPAARASREQVLDFLRERSVQQLKESDPQSFVLPRLDGAAKVGPRRAAVRRVRRRPSRTAARHAVRRRPRGRRARPDLRRVHRRGLRAVSLACANVMSMFGLNRRLRGAAMGHLAAFEATSSVPSRKIAAGIERVGLPDAVAAYFHEHVEADAVHEQVAIQRHLRRLVADEPALRDDVLFGAAGCLHLAALSGGELLDRWCEPELEVAS